MAAAEESSDLSMIDLAYEFSAPRFHDFLTEETAEEVRRAEHWFDSALAHAPSPFMPRIRATRTVQQILCNFNEEQQMQKAPKSSENASNSAHESAPKPLNQTLHKATVISTETTEEVQTRKEIEKTTPNAESSCSQEKQNIAQGSPKEAAVQGPEICCTPAPQKQRDDRKHQTAKKIASMLRNPSAISSKKQLPKSQAKSAKPSSVRRDTNGNKNVVGTPNFAHENRAIKKQKLDGGKSRQILTVNKPSNLPHKTRAGMVSSSSSFCPATAKTCKEDRKMYVREPAAPFVSTAEMMKKFQSGTREVSCSLSQKPKLTLTRPKTPEFETSQRLRSVKIKSSAEIEEEMMAKLPKFKARPLNKKQIFEAPSLPPLPRSIPQLPEFKEFRLETMSRATQNAETSTVASVESTESHLWKPSHLTTPKPPVLQTSLRARPPRIKSSEELEKEKLENIPHFKARPLNRKIFESKGDMGIFCNMKKQVTIPQEFNFSIDKRIPPPPPTAVVVDLFDKLSLCSESQCEKPHPRITTPSPFHLHTEERGAEKGRRIAEELMQKQLEEERARIPRAHPYPYTTDYPVIPPKPEVKPCTKPEPFELESLARHEQEMQREMEERMRMEMEEAEMRRFKAQPILKEDPIPLPEKERKPLTEVQEFNLHVENRAVDRSEFDKKIKEKEMVYKRYREETEAAKMMEEEKALKQLRRTLVPHARPVPNFSHPFLPQKSAKETTKAKSPKLRVNYRKEKRRIVAGKASGAAACHMR
ncbi:protein TPX2-like isoform X1 [Salvia divinorum]|uniref:Protein TPX2-like isoform X1 n=1 Tax=Salvia divinorum TaxID=28513 RepID=A0ABD1HHI5_SALDI